MHPLLLYRTRACSSTCKLFFAIEAFAAATILLSRLVRLPIPLHRVQCSTLVDQLIYLESPPPFFLPIFVVWPKVTWLVSGLNFDGGKALQKLNVMSECSYQAMQKNAISEITWKHNNNSCAYAKKKIPYLQLQAIVTQEWQLYRTSIVFTMHG